MKELADAAPKFEDLSPVFPVADVTAALAFYRDRLGFDLGWIWGAPPTLANICRDAISISLTLKPGEAGTGEGYVGLRGIDAYHAELRARGVAVGELDNRAYGMRDFDLLDVDGNRLVFGEETAP